MDVQAITQIISSVGFPIVAAAAMFYLYDKTIKDLTLTIQKIDTTLDMLARKIDGDAL